VPKEFKPRSSAGSVVRYGVVQDFPIGERITLSTMFLVRDRFRSLDVQRILNAELIPYRLLGGFSPFDNVKAKAIRSVIKLNMGERIDDHEQKALAIAVNCRDINDGDYSSVLGRDWHDLVHLSANQHEFYDSVDLLQPINVTLSTIHQAKGREADHVIVDLELTDRVIDNAMLNPDAERRVMYVACTRAKESLHLCGDNLLI
jgi:superfamily I DNA/RNA helicase